MIALQDEHDKTLLALFREEATEHFATLGSSLEAARANLAEPLPELRAALRAAHSLKGAATIAGVPRLQAMIHDFESCVASIVAGKVPFGDLELDLLYRWLDAAHEEMDVFCGYGAERRAAPGLVAELARHFGAHCALKAQAPALGTRGDDGDNGVGIRGATLRVAAEKIDRQMANVEELLRLKISGAERLTALGRVTALIERWSALLVETRRHARRQRGEGRASAELDRVFGLLEEQQTLCERVNDGLATLHVELGDGAHALATLTDSLHADIRAVRMLPVDSALAPFGRMVRELGRATGKRVRLEIRGGETEVDRDVLEAIKDPVMHLLRNAVDHGVELPEERSALGKVPEAKLVIEAKSRGGALELELADDGRGVDAAAVAKAALERDLIGAEQLAQMGAEEVLGLVFSDGFSTSREVGEVSGRGVGLSVVRGTVEKLGGRVTLDTKPGRGSTFRLVLPLNLATSRLLVVEAAGQRLAFPATSVERVVRLAASAVSRVDQGYAFELEGKPVPVFRLGENLGLESPPETRERLLGVVLSTSTRRAAFIVDRILDEQELVVRSLGDHLRSLRNVSGATVLADGRVLPILSAAELLASASSGRGGDFVASPRERKQRAKRILVVDDSVTTRTLEKSILEAAGYEVKVATDGSEALDLLSRMEFDLVLSDVQMPRIDGLALVRAIKQDARLKALPAVLVSSLDSQEQRQAGLEAGADAYLSKGEFEQGLLLATLSRFV
jgi:two-component system, chemotaxis family, sensor kinase CheA